MNDFEERLSRALRSAADRAPEPGDLSPRPSHRTAVLIAVAAVLIAVAVPVGVVKYLASSGLGQPPIATVSSSATTATGSGVPAGWRAESYLNVTLNVPDTWGYGDIHGCWSETGPQVERPVGLHLACLRPGWGLGVAFLPPLERVTVEPVDKRASVHMVQTADVLVVIVAPDADTADRILSSVRVYGGFDPNGCPATETVPPLGSIARASTGLTATNGSVCWYGLKVRGGAMQGTLVASEALAESQTQRAISALDAAPVGRGPDSQTCAGHSEREAVLLTFGGSPVWVHYAGCVGHGIDGVGPSTRMLTSDVMYWALLPGWAGSLDQSVPHPNPLRTLAAPETTTPATTAPESSGWRTESWNHVTLQVPNTWGEGPISSTTCPQGSESMVQRPGDLNAPVDSKVIFCALQHGWRLGVAFVPPTWDLASVIPAKKSYAVDVVSLPTATVVVVTKTQTLLDRIVASIHTFDGTDLNGCPAATSVPALGVAPGSSTGLTATSGSVCRYAITSGEGSGSTGSAMQGTLVWSKLLSQSETQTTISALESAPVGTAPAVNDCKRYPEPEPEVILMSFGSDQVWVHFSGCVSYGIDGVGPSARQLTPQVMFMADVVQIPGMPSSPHPTALGQ